MNAIDCQGLGEQESKKRQVTALLAPFRESNNVAVKLFASRDMKLFLA